MKKQSIWERLREVMRNHLSLVIIIAAALLLELTMGVMYFSAQSIIQKTMESAVRREMNAIYLCIRNKLTQVEVAVDNMEWVVRENLRNPEWMFPTCQGFVEHNTDIKGCCIMFTPNYYPQKGYWFDPFAYRTEDDSVKVSQLDYDKHDYTKNKAFTVPVATDKGYWCEPYLDESGAKVMMTTFCVPVHDAAGKIVAVVGADISLEWLDEVLKEAKVYQSTQRFLVTRSGYLLAGQDNALCKSSMELLNADDDKVGYETMEDTDGKKVHVFFHPVGGLTDWVLISACYDDTVFGKLRTIRMLLGLLVGVSVLLLLFIVSRAHRHLERLRLVNAEKDRIGGELRVASQIQQSMLPKEEVRGEWLEVRGELKPAREVGGDLYDYYIRDEKLFFCIGDVSGKGAPSAMVMAVIHSLFRAFSAHENNPARVMQAINEACCQGNDSNFFVTLFIGVLDLPTGHLRYCDAGHDAPMVITNGQRSMMDVNPHLPVGVFDDVKYGIQETKLEPDSTLFLYTDGLTEAMNAQHKQFGLERVKNVIEQCHDLSPEEVLDKVAEAVHDYVKDAEQSDDLTMLAIHYTPKTFESTLSETLVLKNDVKEVAKFSTFIKSVMEKLDVEKSLARQLRLAVEEAVVNVIDYAYPVGQEGEIEVQFMSDGKSLKTVIIDSGVAFDPTAKEKADTTLSAEDRQIGGLGILLVRELMDSINYERINSRNILTLTKNISHYEHKN